MPLGNAIDLSSVWADPSWRWNILFSIVFWTALLVMSYLSVRLLSRLPDFEHKDEMLWGARWWGLIFLGIIVLSGIIWYAGLRLAGHFSMLTIYVPWIAFLIALYYAIGSYSMRGPGAILLHWDLKRTQETVQLDDLIERWNEGVVRQQRFKRIIVAVAGAPLAIVLLAHLIFALR